jgi:uncharacterized damage-inducible protein DinB
MNADAFRHLYGYHFRENRALWALCAGQLTHEQFTREASYSRGSVREQIIHLLDAEDVWFSELRGVEPMEPIPPADHDDRPAIRAHWDRVEANTRDYLQALSDEALSATPIVEPDEDRGLVVWQVLLHVVNHATDHRAQLLRSLHDLGVETTSQDYIFYVYEHP